MSQKSLNVYCTDFFGLMLFVFVLPNYFVVLAHFITLSIITLKYSSILQ